MRNSSSVLQIKNVLIGLFSFVHASWQNNCYFFFIKVIRQKTSLMPRVIALSIELILSLIFIYMCHKRNRFCERHIRSFWRTLWHMWYFIMFFILYSSFSFPLFTARKRSCGKVMFLQPCVCSEYPRTIPPPLQGGWAGSMYPAGMLSCFVVDFRFLLGFFGVVEGGGACCWVGNRLSVQRCMRYVYHT